MRTPSQETGSVRRFACTSCGRCCTSGPEMELSEAAALADKFVTSLFLKVWSLPLTRRSRGTDASGRGSIRTDEEVLEEHRRHIGRFSVRDRIDRANARSLHLTISVRTIDREKGRCPALIDKRCGIYETRPLSCRAVPLHFSQPDSQLARSLDAFVRLPGHLCDTSPDAAVVLDGDRVTDPSMRQARDAALEMAKADRAWKNAILSLMDDPTAAKAAGLPTYHEVVRNSDAGFASAVSMLAAWRVARDRGIISASSFEEICKKQISLLKTEIERAANLELAGRLAAMLSEYERAYAGVRPRLPMLSSGGE